MQFNTVIDPLVRNVTLVGLIALLALMCIGVIVQNRHMTDFIKVPRR